MVQMKRMAYRPGPVRQVLIPKEGKPGATRPLGICNFADKLVQKRMQEILESIYDPIFLNCSYGFRQNRNAEEISTETARQANPATARAIRKFLLWAIAPDEANEKYLDQAHFIALPAHIWVLSHDQIEMIK